MILFVLFPMLGIALTIIVMAVLGVFLARKKKHSSDYLDVRQEMSENFSDDSIISQLKLMLNYFSGNLNVLEKLKKDPNPIEGKIIFKNLQQTIGVHGSVILKEWFSQFEKDSDTWDAMVYSQKAEQILSLLFRCGLKKRPVDDCTWSKQAELSYLMVGTLEEGQKFEVISPCWELEGRIFEKGIVKKV